MSKRNGYVVLIWHQDELTILPRVHGTWQTYAGAQAFADAINKRYPQLTAEPIGMDRKLMRNVNPNR